MAVPQRVSGQRFKIVPEMEGVVARWYARQRGSPAQMSQYRTQAAQLASLGPPSAAVLEVAPGPGYLAIELARLGARVTGLDISHTFVEIATANARRARAAVAFHQGDVAAMPFPDASFDLVVCQAAFKNFAQPATALEEMHRVLRPDGLAVIQDLDREASTADIDREVRRLGLGAIDGLLTKWILATMLRRRAYTRAQLAWLAEESSYASWEVQKVGIGLELRLSKHDWPSREQPR